MSKNTRSYVIISAIVVSLLQGCGGGGSGGTPSAGTDTSAPAVTAFSLPATSDSLTVPITSLDATDDKAVTGYLITQSGTKPTAADPNWLPTVPTSVSAAGTGSQTFYCWAKDAAGNVSAVWANGVTVLITAAADPTAPTVTAFTLPASSASQTVSVSAFTATDNLNVAGYLITQSATAPAAGDPGWSATAPTTVAAAGTGSQTFYAWAKDAVGNVSAGATATVTVTVTAGTGGINVSGPGFGNAAEADATFVFAAGTYTYNIAGFATGDKLVFPAEPAIENTDFNDGKVILRCAVNQQVIEVIMDLPVIQDQKIVGPVTFRQQFGEASL